MDRITILCPATVIAVLVCLVGGSLMPDTAHAEPIRLPRYDPWLSDPAMSELRMDVVTPHTPWATPWSGRRLKIVAIAPRWTQRASVELMQRFDFDITAIMTVRSHQWADKDEPHYAWIPYGAETIVTERALQALAGKPDVIVLGWLNPSIMPTSVEQAILDAVSDGAGLVVFNPKAMSEKLSALIGSCASPDAADVQYVVDGLPSRLPPLNEDPRTMIGKGVAFHQGDPGGRIVVVDFGREPANYPRPGSQSNSYLSPPGSEAHDDVHDVHYDYYCSLAGRCMLWAGRNMPRAPLTGWSDLASGIDSRRSDDALGSLRAAAGGVAEFVVRDEHSAVEHRATLKVSADGDIELTVGRLKAGGHYADIMLRDEHGRALDWGTHYFTSTTGASVVSVTAKDELQRDHAAVPIEVVAEGDLDGVKLRVEATDTHGRLVWSEVVPAAPKTSMTADLSRALTMQCDVRAMLQHGDEILAAQRGRVLLRMPEPDPDQYQYGGWLGTSRDFVEKRAAGVMVARGVSGGIVSGDMDQWAAVNVRPTPYITRYYPNNGDEKGLMVRKPCLTDPAFLEKEAAKLRKAVEANRKYSPPAYSLGDDQGMMLSHQDACVSPSCLAAFRDYLSGRYGTVSALNTSWGTQYRTFADAMPVSLDDVLASGQYPRWADHRMYMDKLFVDTNVWARSVVRNVDPEARVGFEGPLLDDSWYGYAWKELMAQMDLMAVYPNPWKFDLVRSFKQPHLAFGGWYGGYAMYQSADDRRAYPWYMLFNGCNHYLFFSGYGSSEAGHPSEAVAPDLRPMRCFAETSDEVNRIQRGIDRLVLGAEYQAGGVAVCFSRPSVHAATVMPEVPTRDYHTDPKWSEYLAAPHQKWALNTEANLRLLDDLGVPYVFVDRTDIAAGALQQRRIRLLVMPFVQALSAAEAAAVRDFVASGGVVLADVRPGVFDEHVKLLEGGALDDVFGIRRDGPAVQPLKEALIDMGSGQGGSDLHEVKREGGAMMPETEGEDVVVKEDGQVGIPMPVDTTVKAAGGTPVITTDGGLPVFIRHTHGKGQAMLMNMAVQHYLTLRAAGQGAGLRDVLGEWLDGAGFESGVRLQAIGRHTARARVFPYRDGETRLIGLLRSHKRLADEFHAFADREPRTFVLHVGERGHVYDVINGAYAGHTDRLDVRIEVATPYLYAVLPYRVTAVTGAAAQRGNTVSIGAAIQSSGGKLGRHVIHVDVTDADGRHRPEYGSDIVAPGGSGTHAIHLALNDPTGTWTIELKDVATGTSSRSTILIAAK